MSKIVAFKEKDIKWIDGGTIFVGANNPVPVLDKEMLLKKLERMGKVIEKKLDPIQNRFQKGKGNRDDNNDYLRYCGEHDTIMQVIELVKK